MPEDEAYRLRRDPASWGEDVTAIVPTDQEPEAIADALIADSLPSIFLDDLDVGGNDGLGIFLQALLQRITHSQASVERDELIRFVNRNYQTLRDTNFLDRALVVANSANDEELIVYVREMTRQMRLVLDGHPESVDVVSSRLLWMCVALGIRVEKTSFYQARTKEILSNSVYRQRITPRAVQYLTYDLYKTYEAGNTTVSAEYAMVIATCTVMVDDLTSLITIFTLLMALSPAADKAGWADVIEDTAAAITTRQALTSSQEEFLRRIRSRRARRISDDDF